MLRLSPRLRASNVITSRGLRGTSVVLALVAATLGLVACSSGAGPRTVSARSTHSASTAPTSPAADVTQSKTFDPYNAAGAVTASIGVQLAGYCWTGSVAAPATGAYRCLAGDQILDPCFAPAVHGSTAVSSVVCFSNPWATGIQMTLTQSLPADSTVPHPNPWALQLADGVRCVASTGTVDQVGALNLTYRCGTTGEAGLSAGASPDGQLTAQYRTSSEAPLQTEAVAVVWHA